MGPPSLARASGSKILVAVKRACTNRPNLPVSRPRSQVAAGPPLAIDQFLTILDDPAARPVLLHCKAGLHRTGILAAVYRMEYEGWGPYRALEELKAHGFGDAAATAANDYIQQYIVNYRPRASSRKADVADRWEGAP